MQVIILVCALVAVAIAAPAAVGQYNSNQVSEHHEHHEHHQHGGVQARNDVSKHAKILRYDSEQGVGVEGYKYAVETSDGVVKEEQATFENAGTKEESLRVVGRFLYPGGPNGELLSVEYIADKDGFQPIGDHFPKNVAPVH